MPYRDVIKYIYTLGPCSPLCTHLLSLVYDCKLFGPGTIFWFFVCTAPSTMGPYVPHGDDDASHSQPLTCSDPILQQAKVSGFPFVWHTSRKSICDTTHLIGPKSPLTSTRVPLLTPLKLILICTSWSSTPGCFDSSQAQWLVEQVAVLNSVATITSPSKEIRYSLGTSPSHAQLKSYSCHYGPDLHLMQTGIAPLKSGFYWCNTHTHWHYTAPSQRSWVTFTYPSVYCLQHTRRKALWWKSMICCIPI